MVDDCPPEVIVSEEIVDISVVEDIVLVSEFVDPVEVGLLCSNIGLTVDSQVFDISVVEELVDISFVGDDVIVVGVECSQGPEGPPGPQGEPGADSVGVPTGGTTRQGLGKASNTDFDTTWYDYLTAVDVDGFYRSNYIEVITADTTLTDAGTYIVFNIGAPTHLELTLPDPSLMNGEEIFVINTPFGFTDIIGSVDGGTGSVLPPNTFIGYRAFQLPPAFGGTWLWGSAQRAGIPYDIPNWFDPGTSLTTITTGYVVTMGDPGDGVIRPIWSASSGLPSGGTVGQVVTNTGSGTGDWQDVVKPTDLYGYQASSDDGTYEYVFKENKDGDWVVIRFDANDVADYWSGSGGYSTVYVDEVSGPSGVPVWADYGTTF